MVVVGQSIDTFCNPPTPPSLILYIICKRLGLMQLQIVLVFVFCFLLLITLFTVKLFRLNGGHSSNVPLFLFVYFFIIITCIIIIIIITTILVIIVIIIIIIIITIVLHFHTWYQLYEPTEVTGWLNW